MLYVLCRYLHLHRKLPPYPYSCPFRAPPQKRPPEFTPRKFAEQTGTHMLQRLLRPRVAVPCAGLLGAGAWVSADTSREARCRAHAHAAGRAVRLAWVGGQIALDYRGARQWANEEPEELDVMRRRHEELQRVAGRAEKARSAAVKSGGAAEAEAAEWARRSRKEAAELGEEIARKRVEHEQTSGLHLRWEALHLRCAERLLALCRDNGGVYVKLGQHLAQVASAVSNGF